MEASRGRPAEIVQVHAGGQPKGIEGLREQAGPREQRGVHPGRQRAPVRGPRLVVPKVREEGAGGDLVWNHMVEHQHVGLLDDLRPPDTVPAEQRVRGHGPTVSDLLDHQGVQPVEARELLV